MKICSKCKIEKPLAEFYKDQSKKDGLHTQCKVCHISCAKKHRQTTTGKLIHNEGSKRYRLKHPERELAGQAVRYAVKTGKMKRSVFCESCGLPAETQGHHPDYSKPLEVDWLCEKCHTHLHERIRHE